ncbi:hypothetical protein [Terrihalobacillus insolitus]|uniref:hypothetical protein n=1 Tax=Terrihalobacillus insolitus TaxID=2950438 RepID=UPI002340AF7B|nr:hypothetical protein [Terrihalobacillus insolitus]MDC3412963.1 hypothetical protein [Terrihalobacillus insolitus]
MGEKDSQKIGGMTLLHLVCCGFPLLLIFVGTAGIGSILAFLLEQWWIFPALIGIGIFVTIFVRKRKAKQNCSL